MKFLGNFVGFMNAQDIPVKFFVFNLEFFPDVFFVLVVVFLPKIYVRSVYQYIYVIFSKWCFSSERSL